MRQGYEVFKGMELLTVIAFSAIVLGLLAVAVWKPVWRFYHLSRETPSTSKDKVRREIIKSVGRGFKTFWVCVSVGCGFATFAAIIIAHGIDKPLTNEIVIYGGILGLLAFVISIIAMTPLLWVTALSEEVELLVQRVNKLQSEKSV